MRRFKILVFLSMFLIIIGLSNATLVSYKEFVVNASISNCTNSLGNTTLIPCLATPDGGWGSLWDGLTRAMTHLGTNHTSWFLNISLSTTMQNVTDVDISVLDRGLGHPGIPSFVDITVYNSNTRESELLSTFDNTLQEDNCTETGAGLNHLWFDLPLSNTIVFDTILIDVVSKTCNNRADVLELNITGDDNNQLPIFNITVNESVTCANHTLNNVDFPVIIDSFDQEGDIILYASGTDETFTGVTFNFQGVNLDQTVIQCGDFFRFNVGRFNPLIAFSRLTGLCNVETIPLNVPIPQFTTFSDSCKVIKAINSTEFYIDAKEGNDRDFPITNMVIYNPFCSRKKEAYVNLDDVFRDFYFNTELYFENTVNNSFNLTFYDNPLFDDIVLRAKFIVNETNNLSVYSMNSTSQLFLFNVDLTGNLVGDKSYIALSISYDFESNTYKINATGENNITTSSNRGGGFSVSDSGRLIKYVGLSISNETQSFLYQENYFYGGFTSSPDFSTAIPNNVTVRGFGATNIGFFVTDNAHDESEFNFQSIDITVTECAATVTDITKQPLGIGLAPLKSALTKICINLDSGFTMTRSSDGQVFDPSRYGFCFLFQFAYFMLTAIISAGFGIFINMMKKGLVFPGFMLIWSLFGIAGYLIFPYSITLILILAIVFAISGLIILRQLFLTGEFASGD